MRVGTYLHWTVVTSVQLNVGKKAMSKGGKKEEIGKRNAVR